jgi:hypothetical protein
MDSFNLSWTYLDLITRIVFVICGSMKRNTMEIEWKDNGNTVKIE